MPTITDTLIAHPILSRNPLPGGGRCVVCRCGWATAHETSDAAIEAWAEHVATVFNRAACPEGGPLCTGCSTCEPQRTYATMDEWAAGEGAE